MLRLPSVASNGIQVKSDKLEEPDETLYVNLSAAWHVAIADGQGVGTITNDD